MPRIFDNIETNLSNALKNSLKMSERADFCVGYFNLRGWKLIDDFIEKWHGGEGNCCRLLVGMQKPPQDELRNFLSLSNKESFVDQQTALRVKKKLAEEFREQLTIGTPNNEDEKALRKLARQIKERKVIVKLYLKHTLHAKLYLLFRTDLDNPITGYLGSSNLTFSGLSLQGELNIDVLDHDACSKLAQWFEERWKEKLCVDISNELIGIIENSWAREELIPPYHIYIKMAYHLSQEARAGLSEFRIPRDIDRKLFEFQKAAIKIACHHINKRGGVLIGDVVGLGKTVMATVVARIFDDDYGLEALIVCPKNLVTMWENYQQQYKLRGAKVLSISQVTKELPNLRRYRLVIIDESHNLRNRDGKRYKAIQKYINDNDSKCVLLSATPYNKEYLDLSNQLRLFVSEEKDLGIRPEQLLRDLGETEFLRRYQCSIRSMAAFEKSEFADDWRELMRLYMIRRTRSFIRDNYADTDPKNKRKYLVFEDGTRSYFPTRLPKTLKFNIDEMATNDQYAKLYSLEVVDIINSLNLPRYGLKEYVVSSPKEPPTSREKEQLNALSRAGRRLMGFCRTNLFKRLESSGTAFLQSIERHILRNYIFLYAIENDKPIPIGTQAAEMLDPKFDDEDVDARLIVELVGEDNKDIEDLSVEVIPERFSKVEEFRRYAALKYQDYETRYNNQFKWLRPSLFKKVLAKDLEADAKALTEILEKCGTWIPSQDVKLNALSELITTQHPNEKILIFTQFADTVRYLSEELRSRGIKNLAAITGDTDNPTKLVWQFSPVSNDKRDLISTDEELRVVLATDILSEGQNLQDCAIVVNYDLPWAIIRLIQRTGRVDRIGQQSEKILCYTFLPAEGIERIINLRGRVVARLKENAEVVGTDEYFFEENESRILDLYNEKTSVLDDDNDGEVDLASYAYQIWKNATKTKPELQKIIPEMPPVVFSTRSYQPKEREPEGVLLYMRTAEGNDALAWVDKNGKSVTESQFAILKAAECLPETLALERNSHHHDLVAKGVERIIEEEKSVGGQLGRPSGARFRTYERLKDFIERKQYGLFENQELLKEVEKVIDEIYRYPLRQSATDTLNRQLRSGVSNEALASLVVMLRNEDRLCLIQEDIGEQEPKIICSMGLFSKKG